MSAKTHVCPLCLVRPKGKAHSYCEDCQREYQRKWRDSRPRHYNRNVTVAKVLTYLKEIKACLDYGNPIGAKLKITDIEREIVKCPTQ